MMRSIVSAILGSLLISACAPESQGPSNSQPIINGVNYVGITVTDLDASTQYYANIMEMEHVDSTPVSLVSELTSGAVSNARANMLRSTNAQIRLMEFAPSDDIAAAPPAALQGPGIAHLCYQVAQSTNMYQRARDGGAHPIGDEDLVQLISRNPVYYGYAKDRDGIIFEVEEVDVEKLPEDRRSSNKYRIRHVSLATANLDRLVAFYATLMDTENPRQIGGKNGVSGERFDKVSGLPDSRIRMAWFQTRNLELEIFEYVSHPPSNPERPRMLNDLGYNLIVFDSDDLDRVRAKLNAAGAFIIDGVDSMDGVPAIVARDPDGNLLAFQVAPSSAVVSSQNFSGNGLDQ